MLATKGILKVQQDTHFGPISVRINAEGDDEEDAEDIAIEGGEDDRDSQAGSVIQEEEEYDDEPA